MHVLYAIFVVRILDALLRANFYELGFQDSKLVEKFDPNSSRGLAEIVTVDTVSSAFCTNKVSSVFCTQL